MQLADASPVLKPRAAREALWGVSLVILSASCFGLMVLFGRLAYHDGVSPASLLFLRFAMAAPVLAALARWRSSVWPTGRSLGVAVLMGMIFVGNSLAYFVGLSIAPAATVATVFFAYPGIVALAAWLLFHERISRRKLVALLLAVAGCLAAVGPTELKGAGGAALALLSAVIYSSYILLARFIDVRVDPLAQASVITGVAALLFGAIVAQQGLTLPHTTPGWGGVIALTMVSTVVAITAFLAGVRRLGATGAATLSVAEPIVAALAAAFFLEEPLGLGAAVGVALVVASTLLIVNGVERQPERR
jgi:drug/metabolite transporter (DMT)-like permease